MGREILIVADNDFHIASFEQAIAETDYQLKAVINFDVNLNQYVEQSRPSVIIIDVQAPLTIYLEKIRDVNASHPTPVVMFTQMNDDADTIEKVVNSGVHAYIVNNIESERIGTIIDTAVVRFKQYQSIKQKLDDTQATLEDRKVIDRAKGLLMENRSMSEQDAYTTLRKMAMDQNKKIGEVAKNVVEMFKFIN